MTIYFSFASANMGRAIARTLNARYQVEPYGLARGNAATLYPVSAFITHLVYLRGTTVVVDVRKIGVGITFLLILQRTTR